MKWKDYGNTLEVSYLSKRMWYLILFLIFIEVILLMAITGFLAYFFWWIGKNDIIVHLFKVLENCGG